MKNFKAKLFGVSLFVLTLAACNHSFDKVVPPSPGSNTTAVFKTPKVLYIIADGARGTQVRDADIPNLKTLIPNAIYSWNSLADATNTTDAANWADMITGVKKEKHNVLTEDFAGNALATYPSIFQRIKSVRPTLRMAAFSASTAFKTNLTGGMDVSESFTSDDAVKTRMVNFLATDTASLILGEFAGIEAAGNTVSLGFDNTVNPAYKTAIGTFDTQVGAILAAIKARATYSKENWMIIITSNKGGAATITPAQNDRTVFSNPVANTFTIIYNAGYNPTFIGKPFVGNSYVGNSVRFLGYPEQGVGRTTPALAPYFNFGDTAGFTISVKVKKHVNPVTISRGDYYYQWPGFLGKRGSGNGTDANSVTPTTGWGNNAGAGWDFCLYQNTWRFFLSGINGFKAGSELWAMNFTGDVWHDLTAVVEKKPDGHAYVRLYTDGVEGITNKGYSQAAPLTAPYDLNKDGANGRADVNLDNSSVLRVGYTPGEMDGGTGGATFGKIDVELKELKIFKVAIPDGTVTQYACDQSIDVSHPYFSYLIGYWPMDEGTGTVIKDKGPVGADFTLSQNSTNGYRWQPFQDLICSPVASNLALLVPKNSDIPTQILSWFNIARQSTWSLDGKVWIAN